MKNKTIRLNKFIASTGFCSRRKADESILAGTVKVNGLAVTELGYKISEKDSVTICDEKITAKKYEYLRFYKPSGYVTTMSDESGRKTVYEFMPENLMHLKPVGRLDKDSSGLLIMTNDGDLINKLSHPSMKIPKVYRVCAQGKLTMQDLTKMSSGMEIEPGVIAYAESAILEYEDKNTVVQMTLYQGLNRQIRKMLDILGAPVISLKRLSHGPIDIQGLKRGQFKHLKPKQVSDLYNYIKKQEAKQADV